MSSSPLNLWGQDSRRPLQHSKIGCVFLNQDAWVADLSFVRYVRKEVILFVLFCFFPLDMKTSMCVFSAALMRSPHKIRWGICMFQEWIPSFNLENLVRLFIPTWITFKKLPLEHREDAYTIFEALGKVVGKAFRLMKIPTYLLTSRLKEDERLQ